MYKKEPENQDNSLDAVKDRINSYTFVGCTACQKGIDMCKHTPCMGTPEDIQKLIGAGYADKLMIDYWIGNPEDPTNPFDEDVYYLKPASLGNESKMKGIDPVGTCTLLVDDKCTLHDKGLKPFQGKMSCCKINYDDDNIPDERYDLLRLWNTGESKELIRSWKKIVNYTGSDEKPELDLANIIELLVSILTK